MPGPPGYKDVAKISQDKALNVQRDRADSRKLLEEWQAGD